VQLASFLLKHVAAQRQAELRFQCKRTSQRCSGGCQANGVCSAAAAAHDKTSLT